MESIRHRIYSHITIDRGEKQKLDDVRASKPLVVSSYKKLVKQVAEISYYNRKYNVYFRGQDKEYLNRRKMTVIRPTFYRDYESNNNINEQLEKLKRADKILVKKLSSKGQHDETFKQFEEIRWAILQHYGVCKTPLIDLTTSLRAACSFALNNNRESGILYVLGLPNINGSISFYVEEQLSILKLLCICPPLALRPHFQDGYLACTFPFDRKSVHMRYLDFSRRLLAKFKLVNTSGKFWSKEFMCIPQNALYPNDEDEVYQICEDIKTSLESV